MLGIIGRIEHFTGAISAAEHEIDPLSFMITNAVAVYLAEVEANLLKIAFAILKVCSLYKMNLNLNDLHYLQIAIKLYQFDFLS